EKFSYDTGEGHVLDVTMSGEGKDTLLFHGGPAVPLGPADIERLNEGRRIIYFDQRGAGLSTHATIDGYNHPFHFLQKNTMLDGVKDGIGILDMLGVEQADVFGGSYGSLLALVTGIKHPRRVGNMNLWGIIDGSSRQMDRIIDETAQTKAPIEYDRLKRVVGRENLHTYRDNTAELLRLVTDGTEEDRSAAAAFALYQFKLSEPVDIDGSGMGAIYEYFNSDEIADHTGPELYDALSTLMGLSDLRGMASIALKIFSEEFGIPDNFVRDNLHTLADEARRVRVTSGAQDWNTRAVNGEELHDGLVAAGVQSAFNLVENAGHSGSDPNMGLALSAAAKSLL
ncbi:MAG: alpha/beta fold hydrolase, partial [Patescibacteria group bacterium]